MLKRKKILFIKKIQCIRFFKNTLDIKIYNSFKKNYKQNYKKRIGFFINKYYKNIDKNFYGSQNKLFCNMSNSHKVPSKKVYHSRFYLNKVSEKLILFNYHK